MISIHSWNKRCWAEVDLDAAAHNYHNVCRSLHEGVRLCCVVKANGYGHGALPLARLYEHLGAYMLAVSNIAEAMQLRSGGISLPILILGYTPAACATELASNDLRQCVYSAEYAKALQAEAQKAGVRVMIHIKVDTGMGRIGFLAVGENANATEEILGVCGMPNLLAEGIFTHFACADEEEVGRGYTQKQYETFCDVIADLEHRGIRFAIRHCANSAATLAYPYMQMDMVRVGILLYGVSPVVSSSMEWKPVMSLKTLAGHCKVVGRGTCISYGGHFCTERESYLATLPVGYADGYPRCAQKAVVLASHENKEALLPIVGRICMDQMMIDATDARWLKNEDEITLFGAENALGVSTLADICDTIPYEILCGVGERVPRIYLKNGAVAEVVNALITPSNCEKGETI